MTPGRRRLVFQRLDEVMLDVESLLLGHHTVGRWTLGQICRHLADSLQFSVEGFPDPPAPWLLRVTVGHLARWSMLRGGPIPEGLPLPSRYRPCPELNASSEADRLREAIASFLHCTQPAVHPLVGQMGVTEWHRFHCAHCAHHLSFAIPLLDR